MEKALEKHLRIFEEFRAIDSDMPLQTAVMYLLVAQNEGLTMADISKQMELAQSTCSRNIAALSKWHRLNRPGLDLVVAKEDPVERRRKVVYLTPKGRKFAERLKAIID